jgi:hypothetical protein
LDSLQVGQEVDVHLNIRGRSWTNPQGETKYFNTLEAWKIEVLGANPNMQPQHNYTPNTPLPQQSNLPLSEEEDDLPF